MSLKKKILGILLALMTVAAIMDYAVHRWVIYPNYAALEQAQAEKDLARCVAALQDEIEHLDAFANDWAAWDDTCRFVADRTQAYIDSNLGPRTFLDNRLNLIAFYNPRGLRVWTRAYDLTTGEPLPIHPFDAPSLAPDHPLLKRTGQDMPIRGIFTTDNGPMLIASRPIITSDRRGPARGSLIMGRLLDPVLVEHLRDKTQVNHRMWFEEDANLGQEERVALKSINARSPIHTRALKRDLQVYTVMPGIAGTPGLLVRADVSRQITSKGFDRFWKECRNAGIDVSAIGVSVDPADVPTQIFTKGELNGLALFNGKAGCAACHVSTDFEPGVIPPLFTDYTYENLGIPTNPRVYELAGGAPPGPGPGRPAGRGRPERQIQGAHPAQRGQVRALRPQRVLSHPGHDRQLLQPAGRTGQHLVRTAAGSSRKCQPNRDGGPGPERQGRVVDHSLYTYPDESITK
jgi:sensor domain CHASE-containing protein